MPPSVIRNFLTAGLALAWSFPLAAADPADLQSSLYHGFMNPPAEAKPRTWWHWMNGNVTLAGIQADLAWMKRVGIGGAHYFDAGGSVAGYKFIEPRLVVGDANWRAAIRTAAQTADRLGLELTTAASPGWSETGGPWVRSEQAMKKYVWSETLVDGGRRFRGALPAPPRTTGVFQNVGPRERRSGANPEYYADALVFAYRVPRVERDIAPVSIRGESGPLDGAKLRDGDFVDAQTVTSKGVGKPTWIVAEYDRAVTVRGILLGVAGRGASGGADKPTLEVSDDGRHWRPGTTLTGPANAPLKSYGFAALTARFFRLMLSPEPAGQSFPGFAMPSPAPGPTRIKVSELVLRTSGVVDRFVEKAGFSEPMDYSATPTANVGSEAAVSRSDVIDLTGRMSTDGMLDWTPPRGRWRIVRLGYSLTGQENHPAPLEATGLEVDKFNARHIRDYLQEYLGRFEAATGKDMIGRRGLQNLLTDSWEAGVQNWTEDMRAEFRSRRGYDMLPWLPVLTGQVVESADASDRFLWDFRRTLQDLLAQHYQILHEETAKRGMKLYAEAQGDGWRAIGDGMEIKSRSDIPTAEYWYKAWAAGPGQPALKADMKESASVAHIYGKPLVANESLTVFAMQNPWSFSPAMLKPVVDEIFAHGVNRILIHTSAHQPLLDNKPGLTNGVFGQFITRNETWAEQAGPFFSYIARSSYLLQQGRHVADIAYFYGEERPLVSLFQGRYDAKADRLAIEVPEGHGYDFINAEALRNETLARDGQLATRSGMQYRVLYMPLVVTALTVPTLKRLLDLVEGGVILVGDRPQRALGLASVETEFSALTDRLWGPAKAASGVRSVGKGKVYSKLALAEALNSEAIEADVLVRGANANIVQLHRRTEDGTDIYFLANRRPEPAQVNVSFRIVGREPRLWHADSAAVHRVSYRIGDGRTEVPLALSPHEAVFVVFDRPAEAQAVSVPVVEQRMVENVRAPWSVNFPAGWGAPPSTNLATLQSWTDNPHEGIRHFSGTATYRNVLRVDPKWVAGNRRLWLDLGDVRELAEIVINGRSAGILWKPPFKTDVTDFVRPGSNRLEIRVTNLWANRLIGDAKGGQKFTWTTADLPPAQMTMLSTPRWSARDNLLPSGLLGPVKLLLQSESGDSTIDRVIVQQDRSVREQLN